MSNTLAGADPRGEGARGHTNSGIHCMYICIVFPIAFLAKFYSRCPPPENVFWICACTLEK